MVRDLSIVSLTRHLVTFAGTLLAVSIGGAIGWLVALVTAPVLGFAAQGILAALHR